MLSKFESVNRASIAICSVVKFELQVGVAKRRWSDENIVRREQFIGLYESLPFDDEAAIIAGNIRAYLEQKGFQIGYWDYMVAATAIANDLIVVTNNVSEFSRIPELRWEDWEV